MDVTQLRAAAVQMEARLCDLPYNIAQAGELAEKALRGGTRVVALPEFFTRRSSMTSAFGAVLCRRTIPRSI